MDEHFNKWKEVNKVYCDKASNIEQQMLYITEGVIFNLDEFQEKLKLLSPEYKEVDVNRIINKLSSIRTFIRHSKGEPSKF